VGLSTLKKNKLYSVMIKKLLLTVFLVINLFFASSVFGQAVGDYRSNNGTPAVSPYNWTDLTSWERWNGTNWVTPSGTSPQGWPGQFTGTGSVLIQNENIISISATITTFPFGTLTIAGRLNLNGDNSAGGMDFNLTTQSIIITLPSGFIGFDSKVNLRLPSTAGLQVSSGGLDIGNPCTANQIIYIGDNAYSKCNGGGALPDFGDLMTNGGTLNAIAASNSPVCQFNSINLIGNYSGVAGKTTSGGTTSGVNYSWSVQAPNATVTTSNTKDYSFTADQTGIYTATLSCSTYFGVALFTNSKTISIIVNTLPSTPTITAGGPTTFCTSGSVTLTSSSASGNTWSTGATTQAITVSTAGTYTVIVNNGTCISATSAGTTVTVNALPTITTQPKDQLDCEGKIVTFKAVASGSGLTYVWQRKLPADASFTTIPVEGNVSYPDSGEIRLVNVGSAMSLSGTQYQVVITNSSGCSITSSPATLLVNEVTGISPSATNVIQCYGTDYSYTVSTSTPPPGSVFSYQWKSSVASGVWNNVVDGTYFSGANTATLNIIKGTPAQSAEYKVQVIFTSSATNCTVTTALTRRITFLPEVTPRVDTITQPDCITPTGSVLLSDLPESDTWTITQNPGGVTTIGTGTSTTISGLAAGTYDFTVTNSSGCTSSPTTLSVTIIAAVTNTWNGITWSNGSTPIITENIVFAGNYNSSSNLVGTNLSACSCTVNAAVTIIINSGHTLRLKDKLSVTTTGSLTFEDTASLVQTNDVTTNNNTGNITYKRKTTPITKMDYTYWSTPVLPFTLGGVSPNTLGDKFYSYDSAIDDWKQEGAGSTMSAGVGYIIRGPQSYVPPMVLPALYEATFVGVPNNGNVMVPVTYTNSSNLPSTDPNFGASYLLGNPYPSAINADTFLTVNTDFLEGTIYFWTHNTQIGTAVSNLGTGVYAYSGDDYASYNFTGGVSGSGAKAGSDTSGNNNRVPSGKIAAGQGFFATAKATGIVKFTNAMRRDNSGNPYNNSQFFKTKNPNKSSNPIEKNRIWLNLINTQGAFKQTLVGYITNATNDYDDRFDGESYDGNEFVDFYSVNQDLNLTIQGRALPFDVADEVPLGFRTTINGAFTINIDQVDGLLTNQAVFIEDKLTNTVFDLKSGNYTFNTVAGTFNDRFVLKYKDTSKTLTVDTIEKEDGILAFYSNNYNTLIIHNDNFDATVNSVALFNMAGQKTGVWDVKDSEQTNIQLPVKNISAGIYIVKVTTNKGESSKKIIVN
jgi:Secretion system C-terminal sorting domain